LHYFISNLFGASNAILEVYAGTFFVFDRTISMVTMSVLDAPGATYNMVCQQILSINLALRNNHTFSTGWKTRCAEYFPYSTYFEGIMSAIAAYVVDHNLENSPENGIAPNPQLKSNEGELGALNGTVHIVDDLSSLSIR
jgi:hypothetical protein